MGLRVCLVTPFAWSRPHDVNEHVAGVAAGLRALGHTVTVLAPSTRAADLLAGTLEDRHQLLDAAGQERAGAAHGHFGAELGETPDVRSGNAGMQNVPADADAAPLQVAQPIAQGENVEQALSRMLVRSVSGVDDVRLDSVGEKMRRA